MATDGGEHVRLYKIWKGNNRFFCGGRLVFGPDAASVLLTTFLISGPSVGFIAQIVTKIIGAAKKPSGASDHSSHILGYPVLVVAIVVTAADLVFLFLTSGRDAGMIPRNLTPLESDGSFNAGSPSMEWINGRTPQLAMPRTKDVTVNGIVVKVKYCDTCLLYRPPRASHCSICNNCVQKFDHHCPWVAQCIGLRNYRFFFLFISSSTFLCVYVFVFSWLNILCEMRYHNISLWRSMRGEVLSLVLIVYTFIAVWFVGGLTVFHFYLISTNQTTYENFRYRYDKKENPYGQGILRNFKELFFSKIPPSLNDFRSWVVPDSADIGSMSSSIGMNMISSRDDIDADMCNKQAQRTPNILQNLEYASFEDDLKGKERQGNETPDRLLFYGTQDPSAEGPIRESIGGDSGASEVVDRKETVIEVTCLDDSSSPHNIDAAAERHQLTRGSDLID